MVETKYISETSPWAVRQIDGDKCIVEIPGKTWVCNDCSSQGPEKTKKPPKPSSPAKPRPSAWDQIKRMGKGAVGLMKAEAGIDAVSDEVMEQRKQTCLSCPSGLYDFGVCGGMQGCKCYLAAKIRIAREKCPMGHWVDADNDPDKIEQEATDGQEEA